MKKCLAFTVLVTLLFTGCKKQKQPDPGTDYYVKFKLNGTWMTYSGANHGWLKPNNTIPGTNYFQLSSTSDDFKNNLAITVQKTGDVNTGTYSSTNNAYTIIADYFKNQGDPAERDYTNEDASGNPPVSFSITLSEITPSYFRGTFTGNYLYDYQYNEKIEITEGEFFIRHNP